MFMRRVRVPGLGPAHRVIPPQRRPRFEERCSAGLTALLGSTVDTAALHTRAIGKACVLARWRKSYAHELSQTAKRRLCGIEAEAKVFLCVIFVPVRGFMMVRV